MPTRAVGFLIRATTTKVWWFAKDVQDDATSSGGAMATMVLFKLGAYTGEARYIDMGEAAVAPLQPALAQAPTGFACWLSALNFELARPKEIAIMGEDAQLLFDVVFGENRPNQVVAWKAEGVASAIPLSEGLEARDGKATTSVCQNLACQRPVTEVAALAAQRNG